MYQFFKKNKKRQTTSLTTSYTPIDTLLKNRQQGLFQQSITNQNIIDALRKGKLFHRKLALNQLEQNLSEKKDNQEQMRNQLGKNYNMDESTKIEEQIEEVQNSRKNKNRLILKDFNQNNSHISTIKQLKEHKIQCYQTKLFNKEVTKIKGYRSCDFEKLQIKLPQLKISDGYGNMNMKKQIKNILDNYKFVNQVNKNIHKIREPKIETQVPKFLLDIIKTSNEMQLKKQNTYNRLNISQNRQLQKNNNKRSIYSNADVRSDKNYYTLYVEGLSI